MEYYYFILRLIICFLLSFAIGVLSGLGLIFEACVGTFIIIFTNIFIKTIKKKIPFNRYYDDDI